MTQKSIVSKTILTLLMVGSFVTGSNQALGLGFGDLKKSIPKIGGGDTKTSKTKSAEGSCAARGSAPEEKLSYLQQKAMDKLDSMVDSAVQSVLKVDKDDFVLAKKIEDACQADTYLKAISVTTKQLDSNSKIMIGKMLESITSGDAEVEKAKKAAKKSCSTSSKKNSCLINNENMDVIEDNILNAQKFDKELMFEAFAGFKNHSLRIGEYAGLAKELMEFSKDDKNWALRNSKKLLPAVKGIKAPIETAIYVGSFVPKLKATLTSQEDKSLQASMDTGGNTPQILSSDGVLNEQDYSF